MALFCGPRLVRFRAFRGRCCDCSTRSPTDDCNHVRQPGLGEDGLGSSRCTAANCLRGAERLSTQPSTRAFYLVSIWGLPASAGRARSLASNFASASSGGSLRPHTRIASAASSGSPSVWMKQLATPLDVVRDDAHACDELDVHTDIVSPRSPHAPSGSRPLGRRRPPMLADGTPVANNLAGRPQAGYRRVKVRWVTPLGDETASTS
jgi:hypothetical protein